VVNVSFVPRNTIRFALHPIQLVKMLQPRRSCLSRLNRPERISNRPLLPKQDCRNIPQLVVIVFSRDTSSISDETNIIEYRFTLCNGSMAPRRRRRRRYPIRIGSEISKRRSIRVKVGADISARSSGSITWRNCN
jgi:hypothetical protein